MAEINNRKHKRTGWWLVGFAVLYAAWVLVVSSDVRGTDSYWYVADIRTLLERGELVSNCYYPVQFIEGDYAQQPPRFMHYSIYFWMVYPFAWLGGAFTGALMLNLLCILGGAWCLYRVALGMTTQRLANLLFLAVPLFPLVFRQGAIVMQESAQLGWVCFSLLLAWRFQERGGAGRYFQWQTVNLLGVWLHPIFIIFSSFALAVGFFRGERRRLLSASFICFVLLGVMVWAKPLLFPMAFDVGVFEIAREHLSNTNNQAGSFYFDRPAWDADFLRFTLERYFSQFAHGSLESLIKLVAMLCLLALLVPAICDRRMRMLGCLYAVVLAAWTAMTVLHQYQLRYLMILLPFAGLILVRAEYLWGGRVLFWRRYGKAASLGVLVFFVLIDVGVSWRLRQSIASHCEARGRVADALEPVPEDARIVFSTGDRSLNAHQLFAYVADPRKVLIRIEDQGSGIEEYYYSEILPRFQPNWLVAPQAVQKALHPQANWVGSIGRLGEHDYQLYQLPEVGDLRSGTSADSGVD